jgi:hypothetical protein
MFRVPFSADEFFGVFAAYNGAVWPAPLVLTGLATVAALLAFRRGGTSGRWIASFLVVLWCWTGVVYHLGHFRAINPAAAGFGALFLMQALLLFWWGIARGHLTFGANSTARRAAAGIVIAYALLIYPLLGILSDPYAAGPTFGTPCPVVIYTFGVLLLASPRRSSRWLLVIPATWAVVGSAAVFAFGVIQDAGLPLSALIAIGFRAFARTRDEQGNPEMVATT